MHAYVRRWVHSLSLSHSFSHVSSPLLSLSLYHSLSCSVALSLSRSLALSLSVVRCPQKDRLGSLTLSLFLTSSLNLTLSLSHSLTLTLSLSLAPSLSRPLALSLSRSRSSCFHNQDGIDGSCRLVTRERANGQWRLQRHVCSAHAGTHEVIVS